MKQIDRIIKFLELNGWKATSEMYGHVFLKPGCVDVELIENDELVFLDDTGDFLHLPFDYYALIGGLIVYRQIAVNFKGVVD